MEIGFYRSIWQDIHWNQFAIADSIKEYLIQTHGFTRGTLQFNINMESGEIKLSAPLILKDDPVDDL
jgi:hypothetical protein